jgi:TRAP transporter 4TM/12TM fusion protein
LDGTVKSSGNFTEFQDDENKSGFRHRNFSGKWEPAVILAAVIYILFHIAWILGFTSGSYPGLAIIEPAYAAISIGGILFFTFLFIPPGKKSRIDRLPWYDIVFMVLALAGCFYFAVNAETLLFYRASLHPLEVILGAVTVLTILEAARRTAGLVFVILVLIFIIYGLFSSYLPGFLWSKGYGLTRLTSEFYMNIFGIFGNTASLFATTIFVFLLFASVLSQFGAGEWFTRIATSLGGKYSGGPAKISVISSALFGTISGSATANVAADGIFTIPMMKKAGFRPAVAAGIEAAASTGGSLTPPVLGAAAFLMVAFLEEPYRNIVIYATIPAVLYYLTMFFSVHLESKKMGLKGLASSEIPGFRNAFFNGWYFIVPILVLLATLIGLGWSAESAGLCAILSLLIIEMGNAFKSGGSGFHILRDKLKHCVISAIHSLITIGPLMSAVGILVVVVGLTGLGARMSSGLLDIFGGNLVLLLVSSALMCIILGTGLPVAACYIFLVVLIGPALTAFGLVPAAVHMFVFYFSVLSIITPPTCTACYVAAAIANTGMWQTAWHACRLGIGAYLVAFLFVGSPALLMIGTPVEIIVSFIIAALACIILSIALSGYFLRSLKIPEQVFAIIAVGIIFWGFMDPAFWMLKIAGAAAALFLLAWLKFSSRISAGG